MLTSAVSYMPYCEKRQGDREESGVFAMQVPNYTTRIEPISTETEKIFLTTAVQSQAYSADNHSWKGVLVSQSEAELDSDGDNTVSSVGNAQFTLEEFTGGEFKTAVGSQCKTWLSARMAPMWFGSVYDNDVLAYIKDNNELFTYTRPTLYDWDITETAQQENTDSTGQRVSVKTLQSKHARTLESSYDNNTLRVADGAYESPYVACRMNAITEQEAEKTLPEVPAGLENSPMPSQWAREFTGVYTPSVTLCKLEANGQGTTFLQPHVYPAAIPNFYYEEIGKERPRVGGVHCSSVSETSTMSLGAMFFLGRRSYKESGGNDAQHNDCVVFGNNTPIHIYGTIDQQDGFKKPPPSLTTSLAGFSGTNSLAPMGNGMSLDDSQQPWNTYMLSYNPSFMNLEKGSPLEPDTESRTAYNRYTSSMDGTTGNTVQTTCEQFLDYSFVHYGPSSGGLAPPAVLTIEGVCKMTSALSGKVESAYTIAQAGNSLTNGMIYKLDNYEDWYEIKTRTVAGFTRQAKEIFPARITKLSCKVQNSDMQGVCGLSNETYTPDYRKKVGSICPLVDVETHSSPRLLSYMCIDNQFGDSDTETAYGRPYVVTSGVVKVEVNGSESGAQLDLSGDIGDNKNIAWPKNVNWATGKFDDEDIQMRFLYTADERMKYAVAYANGEVVLGETDSDNVVEWGGEMHIVHQNGSPVVPGTRMLYTSTPNVRGSSTTSYFFADIAK